MQICMELLILSHTVNNRKTTIGAFNHPPNSSSELMDALYTCLENLDITCFTNFFLLGDFNIDFCNTSHHLFCKLSNLMHVFSLTQVVKDNQLIIANQDTAQLLTLHLCLTCRMLVSAPLCHPLTIILSFCK